MKLPYEAEHQYIHSTTAAHRREFGQYFTPDPIAAVLQQWVMEIAPETVLDPAVGTGKLLKGFPEEAHLTGFDIDKTVLEQAASQLKEPHHLTLEVADYLATGWEERYQGIICNPPYIKFKSYPNKWDYFHLFQEKMGLKLSGYTNLYVLFLLKGLHQLEESGRAAFIVPTEFLNAGYGKPVRALLAAKGNLVAAAVTDFKFSWFEQAATTSTLLFIDNTHNKKDTAFYQLHNEQDLASLELALTGDGSFVPERVVSQTALADALKWQTFYRNETNFTGYALKPLSSFAKVNRGIATGANAYFCFTEQKRTTWELSFEDFLPCLTRASQVRTPFFEKEDWRRLYAQGEAVLLLNAEETQEKDSELAAYLTHGELTGVNQGYLTKRRRPWYKQESRQPAPIWVKVFFREDPIFIRNCSDAVNLTAFHCIYLLPEYEEDADVLMAFLLTSLSKQIFSEQHKQYGKGLKKFEPGDLKTAPVVDLDSLSAADKNQIVKLYREVKAAYMENQQLNTSPLDDFFESILQQAPHSP